MLLLIVIIAVKYIDNINPHHLKINYLKTYV